MTTPTTTLKVTFVSESAAYDNTLGWYDGRTGLGGILFADVESEGAHAPLTPGVSSTNFTVATSALPYIQFFLISDGYDLNRDDADDRTGAVKVIQLSDGSWAVADVDSHGNVIADRHGNPDILNGAGANALFTETSKNAGHVDYASSVVGSNQTAATLAGDTADGATGKLAWEDLAATKDKHGNYGAPGDADYNDAVFQISVVGGNHAPVANADSVSVSEDAGATTINVLANDTDPDVDNTLHVSAVSTTGVLGTVTIAAGGASISYTPSASFQSLAAGETATETFSYTVADQSGATSTANVTVTVVGANDAPTVATPIAGSGNEGSGNFSVNLLAGASDVDHGAVLHVGNLVWTDTGSGLPAGFAFSGNSITVDTNNLAYNAMAQGETFVTHFSYDVIDEHGALVHQTAAITIVGTNDGPIAVADTNAGDPAVESGVAVGGNTAFAGDPSAAGNVLTNDTDVDHGDTRSVTTTGDFTGTYGTLHLNNDGSYTYTLNNADADTNALAQGESASDVFGYTIVDSHGATASSTLTISITGTNDKPVITSGATTGSVKEDQTVTQATGQFTVVDPDHNATQTWTVVGGTSSANADYHFLADSFIVTKGAGANLSTVLDDGFSDGNPPPSSPPLNPGQPNQQNTTYAGIGSFTESGGKLHLDSNNAVSFVGVGTPDPLVGEDAIVRTNIDPTNPNLGLKQNSTFDVNGVFDLVLPDSPREAYGIRVTDRLIGGPGNPPDQPGNDVIELVVRQNLSGQEVVALRRLDFAADVTTNLQSIALNPPAGTDQIRLHLSHVANSTTVTASFEYLQAGTVVGSQSFSNTPSIFNGENWTRAEIVAYAPAQSDSILSGSFGTLDISQSGAWTYTLDNTRTTTQNLAEGQHATDTFTVEVQDQFGAFDTKTISVDVVGTNDAPVVLTGPVSRALTEDSNVNGAGNLTATGLAQFSDVDLTDTHTASVALQSTTGFVPPSLMPLLNGALTASVARETGDGHGQVTWNFALDDNAVQYLAEGQTLTLDYHVIVTDPFGASSFQDVTITITGTNDAPVVEVADKVESASFSENAGVTGDLSNHHLSGQVHFSDPDTADHLTASLAGQSYTYTAADGHTALSLTAGQTSALFSSFQVSNIPATPNPGFAPWTFDATDNQFDFLAVGETLTLTSTVQVSDGHGGFDTATVAVNITGTNDAPSIVAADGDSAGQTLDETNAGLTATGTLTALDPDITDTVTASVVGLTHTGPTGGLSDTDLLSYFSTTTGTIIDSTHTSGQLTWNFNSGSQAFNYLAPGETLTLHYTIRPDDGHSPPATGDGVVTIIINGTNDGPVAVADTNAGDPVVESGVTVGGNTAFAGDQTAVGNVLANDFDVDDGASLSVISVGDFTDPYGMLHLSADGSYTYTLNNADSDTNALAQGESASDVFNYTIAEGQGGTASSMLTIGITGTNDQPVITGGVTTGSVKEDDASHSQATGQLTAVDPDHGAQQFWSVVGGTPSGSADFHFLLDTFSIAKNGINNFFIDTFDDGVPPPEVPAQTATASPSADSYTSLNGATFTESGGKLHIDSEGAVSFVGVGTDDPIVGLDARPNTNINPANLSAGLKNDDDFTVTGVYDLILPDSPREGYGIRLTDRHLGGNGTPPDQQGDNAVDLRLSETVNGHLVVSLRESNFVTDTAATLESLTLAPPPGADQIRLVLTHSAANVGVVHASFDYLSGGTVVGTQSFNATGLIFQGEDWIRAGFIASAPAINDSQLGGTYGNLDIDQTGTWTYSLDNSKEATQSLAQGQHATDTFTVQVADEYGAADTRTITIDVTGANDAPIIQTGPVSRALMEDTGVSAGNLVASGDANFADVDLTDSHSLSVVLTSSTLSGGGALPAGLAAQLNSAVTPSLLDASTGDGHGQYHWDFGLDNSAVQFLAQGQTLTLHYTVTVTDSFGATATQDVAITITGTNDGPVAVADNNAGDPVVEAGVSPGNTPFAGDTTAVGNVLTNGTDVDTADTHSVTAINGNTLLVGTPVSGAYGTLTLNSDGSYTYVINNASPATDQLAQGETGTDIFAYTETDNHGGSSSTSLSITVTGTNDAPAITSALQSGVASEIADLAAGENATTHTASGSVTFAEFDLGDTHTASFAAQADGYRGTFVLAAVDQSANAVGWSFSVADSALDHLAAGQTLTQRYDVTISDGHGGTALQSVIITLTGSNDAPTVEALSGDSAGTTDPLPESNTGLNTSGTLTVTDVDVNDTVTLSVKSISISGPTGDLTPSELLSYFSITPGSLAADAGALNNLAWTFDSGAHTFDFLAVGETLTLQYTVRATDDSGASNNSGDGVVTIRIVGTNDSVALIAPTTTTGSVTEGADNSADETNDVTHAASGVISFADPDSADTHSASSAFAEAIWHKQDGSAEAVSTELGSLALSLDESSHNVDWNYAVADHALDFLAAGESVTVTHDVTIDDHHGGAAVKAVTLTLNGANDAPVIESEPAPIGLMKSGSEFLVNTTTASQQTVGSAAALPNGGFMAVWEDLSGSVEHIKAQLFSADAHAVGGEFQVDQSLVVATNPEATTLANGDVVVTWTEFGSSTNPWLLEGRIFDQAGNAISAEFDIAPTGNNRAADVAALPNGGFVVGWESFGSTSTNGQVKAQVFDSLGSRVGSEFATVPGNDDPSIGLPQVAALANGNIVLHWAKGTQLLSPDGVALSSSAALFDFDHRDVVGLANGNFVVAYSSGGSFSDVHARIFGPDLHQIGAEFTVNTVLQGQQDSVQLKATPNGFMAIWYDGQPSAEDSSGSSVKAQLFDLNGAKIGGPLQVNSTTSGSQYPIVLGSPMALLNDGNIVVLFTDDSQGGAASDVRGQILSIQLPASQINEAVDNSLDETNDLLHQTGGTIAFSDVDLTDMHSASAGFAAAAWHKQDGTTQTLATDLGGLTLSALDEAAKSVGWTYSVNDQAFDFLAAGETVTLTYNITIDDHHGGTAVAPVAITLNGSNDAPIITALAGDSAGQDLSETNSGLTAFGTLSVNDADQTDVVSLSVAALTAEGPTGVLSNTDLLHFLSVGPAAVPADAGSHNNMTWAFNSGAEAFDFLAAGETLTLRYTIRPSDGHDAPFIGDGVVTITLAGINDAPVITAAIDAGSVAEAASNSPEELSNVVHQASGTVSFADVDLSDAHTLTVTPAGGGVGYRGGFESTLADSTDGAAGSIGWTFSVHDTDLDDLAMDQVLSQIYTISVDDGHGGIAVRDVTITITGAAENSAPIVVDDSYSVDEDTVLSVAASGVLDNDADVDFDSLTALLVSGPSHGSLSLDDDGAFQYTPERDFNGTDNFSYRANDGKLDSARIATVNITVNAVNDRPVIDLNGGALAYTENQAPTAIAPMLSVSDSDSAIMSHAQIWISGNFASGQDVLGFIDQYGITGRYDPTSGLLFLSGNATVAQYEAALRSITYFNTSDNPSAATRTISIQVEETGLNSISNVVTATVAVTPVNDAPFVANDSYSTNEDTPLTIIGAAAGVLGNDIDFDSTSLNAALLSAPSHGTLSLDANGSFTYTPAANYSGIDGFSYRASDGLAGSGAATVSIDVAPKADAPVLNLGAPGSTPQPLSGEFTINSNTANHQSGPSIAALEDGGYVVVWESSDQDGSGYGVYGQRYDSNGIASGFEFRANTFTSSDQLSPSVSALKDGGFLVTWDSREEDGSAGGIFAQRYAANGAGFGEFLINQNTFGDQSRPTVAGLASGGYALAWHTAGEIHARVYAQNGAVVASEFKANSASLNDAFPSIAALTNGGFAISWTSFDDGRGYVQAFDPSGHPVDGETEVNTFSNGQQFYAQTAALTGGGFVVVWTSSGQDGVGRGIYGQLFDAGGFKIGGELHISSSAPFDQVLPSVTGLADGGFLVSYDSIGQDGSGYGVFAQRVAANGTLVGNEFQVNQTSFGDQLVDPVDDGDPALVALKSGQVVLTWAGAPPTSEFDIHGRLFSLGNPPGFEDQPLPLTTITAALTDTDGSETLALRLSGFPVGATFSKGALDAASGEWVIDNTADIASLATSPLTMTPPHDYNGNITLSVTAIVTDTAVLTTGLAVDTTSVTKTIPLTVTPVDDAPFVTAAPPTAELVEQGFGVAGKGSSIVNLTIGDIDSTASYNTTGWTSIDATHWSKTGIYGSVVLSTVDNTLTYTLDNSDSDTNGLKVGQTAIDTFNVGVKEDNGGLTGSTNVTFNVHGSNDAPIATADVGTYATDENTPASLFTLVNDTDPEHDALSYAGLNGTSNTVLTTSHGAHVAIAGDHLVYDPTGSSEIHNLGYGESLVDSFNYTVRDQNGATSNANVDINVFGTDRNHVVTFEHPTSITPTTYVEDGVDVVDPAGLIGFQGIALYVREGGVTVSRDGGGTFDFLSLNNGNGIPEPFTVVGSNGQQYTSDAPFEHDFTQFKNVTSVTIYGTSPVVDEDGQVFDPFGTIMDSFLLHF